MLSLRNLIFLDLGDRPYVDGHSVAAGHFRTLSTMRRLLAYAFVTGGGQY